MVVAVKAVVNSFAEIVKVFSSAEVMVEVLLVQSDNDNDSTSIVEGDKGEAITFTHIYNMVIGIKATVMSVCKYQFAI